MNAERRSRTAPQGLTMTMAMATTLFRSSSCGRGTGSAAQQAYPRGRLEDEYGNGTDSSSSEHDDGNVSEFSSTHHSSLHNEVQDKDRVNSLTDVDHALDDANGHLCGDKQRTGRPSHEDNELDDTFDETANDITRDDASMVASEAQSEASMNVLMRYMGCSSTPYMADDPLATWAAPRGPRAKGSMEVLAEEDSDVQYMHDLREGDHVIRWKMMGYCYPIQVHGIVFSAGPDFVTIVDCGWGSDSSPDIAGNFEDQDEKVPKKTRRRMHILTIVDEKEIKKWSKIRYGEEVQLKVHSSNEEMRMQQKASDNDGVQGESAEKITAVDMERSPSAGLEMEEVEKCVKAKIKTTPEKSTDRSCKTSPSSWFSRSPKSTDTTNFAQSKPAGKGKTKQKAQTLRLPKADPPILVLARLRFLLEYGDEPFPPPNDADADGDARGGERRDNLLPPHHLLYANSECIAVFCKTGRWSTLQATIFLHSSTVGNVKQSVTLAMFLGAQTVTVPASGLWGFFGGTTTISLFAAQPWLVPALVGGGAVYVGLPMVMLLKAKGRWGATEKRLNSAFWSMCNTDVIVEMIRCWSGLEG